MVLSVKKIEGEQGYGRFFFEKAKKKSNPGKKITNIW